MSLRALAVMGIGIAGALRGVDGGPGTTAPADVIQTALGDATATMAAAVIGWAVLVALAGRLARLPGRVGTGAQMCWRGLVPAAARVALGAAVGVQGMAGTALAVVDPPAATVDQPLVARPHTTADVVAARPPAAHDRPAPLSVVPGDSLWRIAERHLGCDAPAAAVAAAWPAWYRANSDVIGPDPDLLAVGVVLNPPPAQEHEG